MSRAGKYKTCKLTAYCDNSGEIQEIDIEKGGRNDCKAVELILPKLPKGSIVTMDRGYDSQAIRRYCWRNGIDPVIPRRKRKGGQCRRTPKPKLYKQRWRIEQAFSRYDQFRKLQTRYERNPFHYKAWWCLAAAKLKNFQLTG